jgi:hypothetical protein
MGLLREALVRIRCVIVNRGTYAEVLFLNTSFFVFVAFVTCVCRFVEMSQSSHDASEEGVTPETREMLHLAKKVLTRGTDCKFDKYDGTNFASWQRSVERQFGMRFAQWLLEGRLDGDHLINHVAMIALMDSVNDTFSHITCEESSVPVAYALMKSHYRGACGARKTELFTAITNKRMQLGQSIESYVSQFEKLQQDLKEWWQVTTKRDCRHGHCGR